MTWDSALAGAVCALGAKITFDWLVNRKPANGNGTREFLCHSVKVEQMVEDLQERQKKIWETIVAIREHQLERDHRGGK